MKILIVYCSSHGTTAKAASLLKKQLQGEVVTLNLNRTKLHSDLEIFDLILIGGSIHAGLIQRKVKKFIKENYSILMKKKIGLFLCCMREGEIAEQQFMNAYPEELRKRAIATGLFGGEFLISEMNILEKLIVKNVSGVTTETSSLDLSSIKAFAETVNQLGQKVNS